MHVIESSSNYKSSISSRSGVKDDWPRTADADFDFK